MRSCWAKSVITGTVDQPSGLGPSVRGPAQPVVLDHELVDALQRVVLAGDALLEVVGRPADGLLEQGQQELVLATEVLVEEPERLAGALDDLVHGEVAARDPPRSSARGRRRGSAAVGFSALALAVNSDLATASSRRLIARFARRWFGLNGFGPGGRFDVRHRS